MQGEVIKFPRNTSQHCTSNIEKNYFMVQSTLLIILKSKLILLKYVCLHMPLKFTNLMG